MGGRGAREPQLCRAAHKSWDLEGGPVPGTWNHGCESLKPLPKMPRKEAGGGGWGWKDPGSCPLVPNLFFPLAQANRKPMAREPGRCSSAASALGHKVGWRAGARSEREQTNSKPAPQLLYPLTNAYVAFTRRWALFCSFYRDELIEEAFV